MNLSEQILYLIKENPKITRNEIAIILNIGTTTIYRTLEKLKSDNKIKRIGSNKTGHWEIIE